MCTGFTADGICMSRMCAVSLVNHLIAVADAKQLKCELHKSAVPLIVRTLLVVKAENMYRNTIIKCTKRWKHNSAIKLTEVTTSSVLEIRRTLLLWISPLSCSVVQ